jgi:hypothetical protein
MKILAFHENLGVCFLSLTLETPVKLVIGADLAPNLLSWINKQFGFLVVCISLIGRSSQGTVCFCQPSNHIILTQKGGTKERRFWKTGDIGGKK